MSDAHSNGGLKRQATKQILSHTSHGQLAKSALHDASAKTPQAFNVNNSPTNAIEAHHITRRSIGTLRDTRASRLFQALKSSTLDEFTPCTSGQKCHTTQDVRTPHISEPN